VIFPDKPLCHVRPGGSVFTYDAHPVTWRAPELFRQPSAQPFRTCSYCGSIHPEDLFHALRAGAHLHGSDWKYGWPHKFYVEGIPNPLAGQQVEVGSRSYPILECPSCRTRPDSSVMGLVTCPECNIDYTIIDRRNEKIMGLAPPDAYAKFYNEHLNDLTDPDTFGLIAEAIYDSSQIAFILVDGKLKYRAPRHGFQV
jgi:hypothetical protein